MENQSNAAMTDHLISNEEYLSLKFNMCTPLVSFITIVFLYLKDSISETDFFEPADSEL